jgi:hypothetical protein
MTRDNSKSLFELTMVSAASISENYPAKHAFERQERRSWLPTQESKRRRKIHAALR